MHEDFEMTEDGKILLTRDTIVKFHRFISRLIMNFHSLIVKLGKYRIPEPSPKPDDKGSDSSDETINKRKSDLESLLTEAHLYVRALIDLSSKSRTFSRYIQQRPVKRFISVRALESRLGPMLIPKVFLPCPDLQCPTKGVPADVP
jgi:hypothetical protein